MRKSVLLTVTLVALTLSACSKSSTGAKGSMDTEGSGGRFDDGSSVPSSDVGSVLKDINFSYDSSDLSSSAMSTLKSHADWLKSNKKKLSVEGHCDERGTVEYNLALGDRRAKSAFNYLRGLGVPATDMKVVSYGEELPLDPGHDESAWAKNRRDHFSVE